jgi:hypothetical protein
MVVGVYEAGEGEGSFEVTHHSLKGSSSLDVTRYANGFDASVLEDRRSRSDNPTARE